MFIHPNYTLVHFVGQVLRQVQNNFLFEVSVVVVNIDFLIIQTKQDRDRHITSVHTREKYFPCKICPSKFSTAVGLRGTN